MGVKHMNAQQISKTQVVAYIRVSTGKQEASGLGLEAQQQYIERAAQQQGWEVVATYSEALSGAKAPEVRPECAKAIEHAKALNCPVVVAKLDRLSRDVEHIASLMKRVQIKVATMPQADNFQLHLFAALAEQERTFISQRTKDALKALKARADNGCIESVAKVQRRTQALERGRAANNTACATKANKNKATTHAQQALVHILQAVHQGCSTFQAVADWLNSHSVVTSRGNGYSAVTARRLMIANNLSFKYS